MPPQYSSADWVMTGGSFLNEAHPISGAYVTGPFSLSVPSEDPERLAVDPGSSRVWSAFRAIELVAVCGHAPRDAGKPL